MALIRLFILLLKFIQDTYYTDDDLSLDFLINIMVLLTAKWPILYPMLFSIIYKIYEKRDYN